MIGSRASTAAQKGGDDMAEPLTSRQREILEYLRFRQKIRSYPPTVREIGEAVGLSSSSTVQNHLNTLERKGYIRRDPTKSRTIEVVDVDEMQAKLNKVVAVPLIGRGDAGRREPGDAPLRADLQHRRPARGPGGGGRAAPALTPLGQALRSMPVV